MDKNFIDKIGVVAAFVLPLFNIPLIIKIVRRRSSEDFSIVWALGVWICIVLMAPSGFTSTDIVWKVFNIMNLILFSCVAFTIVKYRKKKV